MEKLYKVQKKNYLKYKKKYKKNILLLKFEKLTEKTDKEIKKIEKFLNTKKNTYTASEIKYQKGNRNDKILIYKTRRNKIIRNISDKFKKKLIELENLYIKEWNL